MKDENWKELKRLHDQGWALHWLRPNSKVPVESKWTKGERKSWDDLKRGYRPGYNIGVRLGRASGLGSGPKTTFLGVIDCDVKSTDPKHVKEMEAKLTTLLNGAEKESVTVLSGRGNGSRHIYVRTKKPLNPARFSQSRDKVKVHMPSVKPSRADGQAIGSKDISTGFRMRPAWEISIMGEGQQVVLPPSIHPDSGKSYRWAKSSTASIPLFRVPTSLLNSVSEPMNPTASAPTALPGFIPLEVDLLFDPREVPESLVNLILNGDGCTDRSASLYVAAKQLARLKFSENEILSVLSDRENFLGRCAYDHTGSKSRMSAVKWLRRYTTAKGTREVKEESQELMAEFSELTDDQAAAQLAEVFGDAKSDESWKSKIKHSGQKGEGPPKPSIDNICLILSNAITPGVFQRDLFRCRESYGFDTPWGGKKGVALRDTDTNLVRQWLDQRFRFEPKTDQTNASIDILASQSSFHPVRDYLNGLPEWDGIERLDTWLHDKLGARAPKEYLAQAFRKWMVAAVTRIFEPGAQFDWMLVLEGIEGLGKSTFFRNLASSDFFRDNLPDLRDKDSASALDGVWIVELGEVEEYFRKNQREVFKAYLTRRIDKYRPVYGRKDIEAPRQCVFAGSTNEERFLHSDSGNRRVVPVRVGVGPFDFHATGKWRDQLWAEAMMIYRMGLEETFELEGEAKEYARKLQTEEKRVLTDADLMGEMLVEWKEMLDSSTEETAFDLSKFSLKNLFLNGGPLGDTFRLSTPTMMQAGRALVSLGARKRKVHGKQMWSWGTPEVSPSIEGSPE